MSRVGCILERMNLLTMNTGKDFEKFYTKEWEHKVSWVFFNLQTNARKYKKNPRKVFEIFFKEIESIKQFTENDVEVRAGEHDPFGTNSRTPENTGFMGSVSR